MDSNRIRSEIELCQLNFSCAWHQTGQDHFSPAVSRFTREELHSGMPFYTENEPIRFSRNKSQTSKLKGHVEVYALNWLARYNRMLKSGALDAQKRASALQVPIHE